MSRIVVFGASGHAKVVLDIIKRMGQHEVVGIIDGSRAGSPTAILNQRILGCDNDLPKIVSDFAVDCGIVAVGDNYLRSMIHRKIEGLCPGFKFGTAIHPGAYWAEDVIIGEGSVVMAGAVLNSGSKIGRSCILNTNCSLDHDSQMEDFSSFAPGVSGGGNVTVGTCSAVSIGAIIKHGVRIGEHAVVGAGAIVMRDIPPFTVSYGQPCRFVRDRIAGERYL